MRTAEQILKIKKSFDFPKKIDNFLTEKELNELIFLYKNCDQTTPVVYKNTGPITVDIKDHLDLPVFQKILKSLEKEIGKFKITAGFFFWTNYPHIIHNDDTYELPDTVYKGITIPLYMENFLGQFPKLCFFNQHYFHGPAKFFNGSDNIPTFYNKQIYDYSLVDNKTDENFIDDNNLFTHLNPKWLEGLSLQTTLDWKPGSALIFDSVQLHCASDFRQLKIKSKLGISIFTKR